MLVGWRYPATGSLGAAVSSVVTDPRDLDPIYITTMGGRVYALGYAGNLMWTYPTSGVQATAAIQSLPAVEARSGRLFYGDDAGMPRVIGSDGRQAFEVLSGTEGGAAIRSSLAIDEVRRQTDYGTRLVRVYYFGAEDGWVYRIESQR
jgi:hypothetical protein